MRCAPISSRMPSDQNVGTMEVADSIRLFLCGDVMTGRGIDQILPHPNNPALHEPMRELLLKLLSPKYEDRFLSADAFLTALRGVQAQLSLACEVRVLDPFCDVVCS